MTNIVPMSRLIRDNFSVNFFRREIPPRKESDGRVSRRLHSHRMNSLRIKACYISRLYHRWDSFYMQKNRSTAKKSDHSVYFLSPEQILWSTKNILPTVTSKYTRHGSEKSSVIMYSTNSQNFQAHFRDSPLRTPNLLGIIPYFSLNAMNRVIWYSHGITSGFFLPYILFVGIMFIANRKYEAARLRRCVTQRTSRTCFHWNSIVAGQHLVDYLASSSYATCINYFDASDPCL